MGERGEYAEAAWKSRARGLSSNAVISYIGTFGDTDATKGSIGVKRYPDPGISMLDSLGDKMD